MTLFEYVAVAASLICSFAAVRLLGGVTTALRPESRYWIHALWIFMMVFQLSTQWWLFWAYHDIEWDYGRFILALAPFAILYVIASLLVPNDMDAVSSWKDHYYEIRVRVFSLSVALISSMILNTIVLLGHPVLHPRRIIPGTILALFAAGLASERPKTHAVIVLAVTIMMLAVSIAFLRPGSFGIAP